MTKQCNIKTENKWVYKNKWIYVKWMLIGVAIGQVLRIIWMIVK